MNEVVKIMIIESLSVKEEKLMIVAPESVVSYLIKMFIIRTIWE